ncbi:MAG TPA: hypothetical protein VF494_11185 [Candidatus Limnocylindrales bacterium]
MDWLQVALRILHIGTGIFWVGGAALFFFYIEPTLNKLGPNAELFVDEIINRRKLPIYFAVVSTLTVLGGVLMYWRDSNGLSGSWVTSPTGLAFGLGGICALIAWVMGFSVLTPAVQKVGALGAEMKAAGGPPSAELMGRMHAAQERVRTIGAIDLVLVLLAVLGMATARYLA